MKPAQTKYSKSQKGGRLNPGIKNDSLKFGDYGLVANQPAIIFASHLASAQLAIKRVIKREGKLNLRIFPHTPVTKKPSEVRMGKGKGSVNHYIAKVQKGSIILEINCNINQKAFLALSVAKSKLPISSSIIRKE